MPLGEYIRAQLQWVRRHLVVLFSERQILIRANGYVRYLTVGWRGQLAFMCVAAMLAGWTVTATVRYIDYDADLSARDNQIADDRAAYQNLLADVAGYKRKFDDITGELEDSRDLMLSLVEQNTALQHSLSNVRRRLQTAEMQRGEEADARQVLKVEVEKIEQQLKAAAERNAGLREDLAEIAKSLSDTVEQRDLALVERQSSDVRIQELEHSLLNVHQAKLAADGRLAENSATLNVEITDLQSDLHKAREQSREAAEASNERGQRIAELETKLGELRQEWHASTEQTQEQAKVYQGNIANLNEVLRAVHSAREQALQDRKRMVAKVETLEGRLIVLQTAQEDAITRMIDHTVAQIGSIEKVVSQTGLDLSGLLADGGADYAAQGGPFIAAPKPEGIPGEGLQASLTALDQHMNHWEMLRDVVQRVPLSAPLGNYHVTSSFGKRRDPVNKRWAMHYGLDLGGPRKSKVYATSPGKVVRAGWLGRYGRMVEVDHGAGLRTRYGHLNKVLVKVGQEVAFKDEVGLLGSSGRSTGPHLHYEVIFNGKSMDPMKFIKAGQHVFQVE